MLGCFLCRVHAPNGSRTRGQVILFTCSLLLQVDGTCWVAFFAVCMHQIALELVDKLSCLPVPCFFCRVYALMFTCTLLLQVDGTCWVAFFAVCMLQMALELMDKLSCLPVPCFYRLMVRAGLLSLPCVCSKWL